LRLHWFYVGLPLPVADRYYRSVRTRCLYTITPALAARAFCLLRTRYLRLYRCVAVVAAYRIVVPLGAVVRFAYAIVLLRTCRCCTLPFVISLVARCVLRSATHVCLWIVYVTALRYVHHRAVYVTFTVTFVDRCYVVTLLFVTFHRCVTAVRWNRCLLRYVILRLVAIYVARSIVTR